MIGRTSLVLLSLAGCQDSDRAQTTLEGPTDGSAVASLVADPPDTTAAPPVDPCEVPGNVCTWLGVPPVPDQGLFFAGFSAEGLPRTNPPSLWLETTLLYLPLDITFAADGTAYYPDYNNHRIRRVGLDGLVTTMSGTGLLGDGPNDYGVVTNCWEGCDALSSAWNHPTDIAIDPADPDRLYVAAWHNSRLSTVDVDAGLMSWAAFNGGRQYGATDLDGDGDFLDDAVADLPSSVAFSSDGSLYVSDQANHVIRKIDLVAGTVTVVAGEPRRAGMDGDGGPADAAHLHGDTSRTAPPSSKLVIDANDVLYAVDTVNGVIRTVDLATGIIDTFAGRYESAGAGPITDGATGVSYESDYGSVTGYSGDGGPALDAVMNEPADLALGIDGEVYIADRRNNCVRVVRDGIIDRFAGQCGEAAAFDGEGGPALDASFGQVYGVAVDPDGNVYIADTDHQVIRRVKTTHEEPASSSEDTARPSGSDPGGGGPSRDGRRPRRDP